MRGFARARVLRHAAELVVAAHAVTAEGCRRAPDYEVDSPHHVSDPAAPPCRRWTEPFVLRGEWAMVDGVDGVILEALPPGVAPLDPHKPALGGVFVQPRYGMLTLGAASGSRCEDPVLVPLPEDRSFSITVP